MQEIMVGEKTVREACELLGVSERHGYRILGRVREKGALGVIHGNRGRMSCRRFAEATCRQVLAFRQGVYAGFNDRHFAEELREAEGIPIGRESVRKLLRGAGIVSVRPVKRRKHRLRRTPREQFGQMLQGDSSPHDWLEERGPRLELVHFVDDATGHEWADFFPTETTEAYFCVLLQVLETQGIPQSLYVDHHSVFRVNREQTVGEQLSGRRPLTTFGRAMEELCIQMIYADSPQAKGRVERRGGLHQDRLVSELRKAKATTLGEARRVLKQHLRKINRRFAKDITRVGCAFTPLPAACDLQQILCWKEERTVANDNTITFQGRTYQLPQSKWRSSWAKCKVAVHLCLDRSLHVFYKKQRIAYFGKTTADWSRLPVTPQLTRSLAIHSPTLTFSLGH